VGARQRVHPHWPEENGLMERADLTLREARNGQDLINGEQADDVLSGLFH
jgi:hypothetical protein